MSLADIIQIVIGVLFLLATIAVSLCEILKILKPVKKKKFVCG